MSEITISTDHPDAGRIYAEALDRVTAERDAALADLKAMGERYQKDLMLSRERWCYGNRADVKISELQQRLTAADERAGVLQNELIEVEVIVQRAFDFGFKDVDPLITWLKSRPQEDEIS